MFLKYFAHAYKVRTRHRSFFLRALELFFLKWEADTNNRVRAAIAHFKKEWTNNSVSCWARGNLNRSCVINNNGLETTNNVIKNEVTMRNPLPLLDFCREICTWLETQSRRRNSADVNYISFSEQATSATCDWTEALSWAHGLKCFHLNLENYYFLLSSVKNFLVHIILSPSIVKCWWYR